MFRGGAKSTLAEGAAIWATGYGHCKFVLPIGATDEASQQALDSIQMELETNDLLLEIFPALCHAARALEGVPQRAKKQTINGARTHIEWTTKRCVFPTVQGFEGSGAILWPRSITARGLRGTRFKRPDGTYQRPDLIILDDLQTDESAASKAQSDKIIKKIRRTVLRLGGHKDDIACVCNATPIEPDDAIDQLSKDRTWRTLRAPMLKSHSKAKESHWLGPYADLRTNYADGDVGGKAKAHAAATAFYKKHRKEMDAGAVATWESCFVPGVEISAIQHAYNILLEIGEDAFEAECQMTPPVEQTGLQRLTVDEICAKQSRFARGVVPPDCTEVVTFTDLHPSIFYWHTWGYAPGMTGYLVDHGTFPDQRRKYFSHANHPVRLHRYFPKRDDDARMTAALGMHLHGGELTPGMMHPGLLTREWIREDKLSMRPRENGLDANGQANDATMKFIPSSPYSAVLYPSFGTGVTHTKAPMRTWPQARKNPQAGPGWIPTRGGPGQPRGCMHDTNYWGTRFHRALALPEGSQGALYLFKTEDPRDHKMLAEHFLAQPVKEFIVKGEPFYEFGEPEGDNHHYDCAIGCMVGASRAGISNIKAATPAASSGGKKKAKHSHGW
jgi:hypothetical protein